MVFALAALYLHYEGRLPWIQGMFYGMGAAVIAIVAISAYKLTRRTIGRDWLPWLLWLSLGVVPFVLTRPRWKSRPP
jgi:chromate transporter